MGGNIFLKVEARLLSGIPIKEEQQLALSLTQVVQEDAESTTHLRCVRHRVLPQSFFLEETAMREAHGKGGIDVLHLTLKAKHLLFVLGIKQVWIFEGGLLRENQVGSIVGILTQGNFM